jgi:hypothetical protein
MRLSQLGVQRLRILGCLGGDTRQLPQYFDPQPGENVLEAFERFVERMVRQHGGEQADSLTISLLATGRLLSGDLSGADDILDHLPAAPPQRDHGAGHCLNAGAAALSAVLPLPAAWSDSSRWLAGSPERAELQRWLEAHRAELTWRRAEGVYTLG